MYADDFDFSEEYRTRMLVPDDIEPWEQDPDSLFHTAPAEDLPAADLGTTQEPAENEPSVTTPPPVIVQSPQFFSYYDRPVWNKTPNGQMTLADAYRYITSDTAKAATEKLRTIQNEDAQKKFKERNFDYVTFAGVFTRCQASDLVTASGFIVMDIDHLADEGAVEDTFNLLLSVPRLETLLLFRSPRGLGLKWVIPVVNNGGHDHKFYFTAVENYLKTFDIEVDPSGKDICRPCFLPFDPNAFINSKYL